MTVVSPYERLDAFLKLDRLFYSPVSARFYAGAVDRMLALLAARPGDVVLDAGCGVGRHSIRAATAGFKLHALDLSAPAIAEARARAATAGVLDRITFEQGDITALPFRDESFTYAFSWGVVIHVPAIEAALDSLARILRPRGRLALYVTNRRGWGYRATEAARRLQGQDSRNCHTRLGTGHWHHDEDGSLWVWRIDADGMTSYLASRGLRRLHRVPGMLTEAFLRIPSLARPLMWTNRAWLRMGLPAGPAACNLLIFEKSD